VWQKKFRDGPSAGKTWRQAASWGGWAVAALVAVVAAAQLNSITTPRDANIKSQEANLGGAITTASEALQKYLAKGAETGNVLGEIPTKVLVRTTPAAGGTGYEVVFIRQIMERAIVPDLYHVTGENEAGQPALARWIQPVRNSM